jgi:hypothetical protein
MRRNGSCRGNCLLGLRPHFRSDHG